MTFTDFVCLLLGGGARSAIGGRAERTAGEKTAEAPRANTKRYGPVRMHRPVALWSKLCLDQ